MSIYLPQISNAVINRVYNLFKDIRNIIRHNKNMSEVEMKARCNVKAEIILSELSKGSESLLLHLLSVGMNISKLWEVKLHCVSDNTFVSGKDLKLLFFFAINVFESSLSLHATKRKDAYDHRRMCITLFPTWTTEGKSIENSKK